MAEYKSKDRFIYKTSYSTAMPIEQMQLVDIERLLASMVASLIFAEYHPELSIGTSAADANPIDLEEKTEGEL